MLIVWKLERLGRSMRNLVLDELPQHSIHYKNLKESIDTSSQKDRLIFDNMLCHAGI